MDVYWLEQSEADVPTSDDWLSENEAARLNSFRFAKRRSDWRLGRWTAKRAVAASLKLGDDPLSLKQIEIVPASTGQPEVTLRESGEPVTISISHRNGIAICALAIGNSNLGCDLEIIEPRSDAFVADYFTDAERELIAQAAEAERPSLVCLLWSAKESALKALHVGLRADARSVEVELSESVARRCTATKRYALEYALPFEASDTSRTSWRPFRVHCADGIAFRGWWQRSGNTLRTVVAAPPTCQPIELPHAGSCKL